MKKKTVVYIVLIIAVIAISTYFFFRSSKRSDVKYITESVTRGKIVQKVTATGTVNPEAMVIIGSQVSGKISELYVDFNSPITKGQLLAKIDPLIYQSRVDQARFNLNLARENLKKNEVTLKDAEKTLRRKEELRKKSFASDEELDSAQTAYDLALAQINVTKAQIDQQKAALEESQTNLKYTNILSPVDGIIITRDVDAGQTVVASMQTPTLFTAAKDLTRMQINTNVDEADIGKIAFGQDVEFTVDAYTGKIFNGKVSQIRNSPQTLQNVVTYDVVVDVSNPEKILKPGMTASVSVTTSVKDDVLRVPSSSLRFIPRDIREKMIKDIRLKKEYGYKVWKEGDGVKSSKEAENLVSVDITPDVADDFYTEVASGGLKEGDKVIIEAVYKE